MAQTVLEIKANNSYNSDNSYFSTVYGEPILLKQGSTIDYMNSFIDLGLTQQNLIYIPYDLRLGIDFYKYEYDIPKVPITQGTDPDIHNKRNIYFPLDARVYKNPNDLKVINTTVSFPPSETNLGYKSSLYGNSNLPAFLQERTGIVNNGNNEITETFESIEETAYVDIPAGYYTKIKFTQLVNDQFNLIVGSFTNNDKPLEQVSASSDPAKYDHDVSVIDYQIPPNSNSSILKAYEYSYTAASVLAHDPYCTNNPINIYINDRTFSYWYFPVYTDPPNTFIPENFMPYTWYNNDQSGFMSGTTKFSLQFDATNNIFYIDYLHSPILDDTQKEVVLFTKSKPQYFNLDSGNVDALNIGYKANGSLGGIVISRLYSYELSNGIPVSTTNTGFWQKNLGFGFDDDYHTQFTSDLITDHRTFYYNTNEYAPFLYQMTYNFTSTYPDLKYLQTATTTPLVPVQWLQQSNYTNYAGDKGMSIYSTDIPKTFQSIGNRVIYGDNGVVNSDSAYFLIEVNISHVRNDNYRDQDSYRQIMNICGKTYTSDSFVQSFDDGSVQTINISEDIYIDKIEVKILNPDKTLAVDLGNTSTIFLKLTQPIIVEKK